jgi:hypothetical protein
VGFITKKSGTAEIFKNFVSFEQNSFLLCEKGAFLLSCPYKQYERNISAMKGYQNYTRQFFAVENPPRRWANKTYIEKPPVWCSVDLRDGNQALITPMSLDEKLEFFKLLCKVGFK